MITDFVHHRDVARKLKEMPSVEAFAWKKYMRFYYKKEEKSCSIEITNVVRAYGFEYLGVGDRLVQTPLTDRCYITLCQALHLKLGGNPFGPAGTGKTESVKALGG